MPVRVKQDRTRRSGHKHSLNIQDFPRQEVQAGELVGRNLRIAHCTLSSNLAMFGGKLSPGMKRDLTAVVKMLEVILR